MKRFLLVSLSLLTVAVELSWRKQIYPFLAKARIQGGNGSKQESRAGVL